MNAFRLASCEGKHRFETYALAAEVAHKSAKAKGNKRSAYKCELCHGYHVGQPIRKRAGRRQLLEHVQE